MEPMEQLALLEPPEPTVLRALLEPLAQLALQVLPALPAQRVLPALREQLEQRALQVPLELVRAPVGQRVKWLSTAGWNPLLETFRLGGRQTARLSYPRSVSRAGCILEIWR